MAGGKFDQQSARRIGRSVKVTEGRNYPAVPPPRNPRRPQSEGGTIKGAIDKGFAVVIEDIPAMKIAINLEQLGFFNPPEGFVEYGIGRAWALKPISGEYVLTDSANSRQFEAVELPESELTVYEKGETGGTPAGLIWICNACSAPVAAGKIVQWWRVGDFRFIDAEDCS